jgi:AraC-like DNA-binding protein
MTVLHTTDADAVPTLLATRYGPLRACAAAEPVSLHHRRVDAGLLALESVELAAPLVLESGPLDAVVVIEPVTAELVTSARGLPRRHGPGEIAVAADPGHPLVVRWGPGATRTCVIGAGALARVADPQAPPPRFLALDPRSPAAAARWRAVRAHVAQVLDDPWAARQPLLVGRSARLLAAVTLAAFPTTTSPDTAGPSSADRRDASAAAVRRAVAFLEAHVADDVSVGDIAAAARVSVRALQLAFRRHLDTSPTAYLRRLRLDHAHRELRAADPDETRVSEVAARWGFGDHSRFTARYHRRYGAPPSTTLRDRAPLDHRGGGPDGRTDR